MLNLWLLNKLNILIGIFIHYIFIEICFYSHKIVSNKGEMQGAAVKELKGSAVHKCVRFANSEHWK